MKLGLILIGMPVVALVALAGPFAVHRPALAQDAGQMALTASGDGVSCDNASDPSSCTVPAGSTFTLSVETRGVTGYIAILSFITYGGLKYNPTAQADDEIVWPDLGAVPVRSPAQPLGTEGFVKHGGFTGFGSPPPSNFEGAFVQVSLTCPAQPQSFDIQLIVAASDNPNGAEWILPDRSEPIPRVIGQGRTSVGVPPGTQNVGLADKLTISCGGTARGTSVPGPTTGGATGGKATPTVEKTAAEKTAAAKTPAGPGTPSPTPKGGATKSGGGGSNTGLWIIVGVVVAVAVVGGGAGAWWYLRRRQAG